MMIKENNYDRDTVEIHENFTIKKIREKHKID